MDDFTNTILDGSNKMTMAVSMTLKEGHLTERKGSERKETERKETERKLTERKKTEKKEMERKESERKVTNREKASSFAEVLKGKDSREEGMVVGNKEDINRRRKVMKKGRSMEGMNGWPTAGAWSQVMKLTTSMDVERRETERKEMERKEMERKEKERKETKRKETERKEIERKESERMEMKRKEMERKETERKETERKEKERKETEKREIERKESERLESERKELERKETERKEMERREMERREIERKESERLESERKELERKEMERREMERKVTERKEMEKKELDRKETLEEVKDEGMHFGPMGVMRHVLGDLSTALPGSIIMDWANRADLIRGKLGKPLGRLNEELVLYVSMIREGTMELLTRFCESIRENTRLKEEAERKETERKEMERMESGRKESERMEMERMETERMETERKVTERKEMERKETERKEMERKEMEWKKLVTQLQEAIGETARLEDVIRRMSTERKKIERKESERMEMERKETERKETERKETERKELERKEEVKDGKMCDGPAGGGVTIIMEWANMMYRKRLAMKKEMVRKETERKKTERKEMEVKETERKEKMERKEMTDAAASIAQSTMLGPVVSEGSNAPPSSMGDDSSLPPLPQRATRNFIARRGGVWIPPVMRTPPPMVNRGVETGMEAFQSETQDGVMFGLESIEAEWRVVARRSRRRGSGVEDGLSSPPLPPRPLRKRELIVVGFCETAGTAEIMEALCYAGGCPEEDIRMGPIRTRNNGLSTVWVQLPVAAALMAAEKGRILIGRTAARVELLKARPLQCFKCWAFGHRQDACRSVANRLGACYKCGQTGHFARECENSAHCAVCFDEGKKAHHRMGGPLCAAQERHRELSLERKEFGKEGVREGRSYPRILERNEFERKKFGKEGRSCRKEGV